MNQTIADIFGSLLKLLHILAIIVLVAMFATGIGGANSWMYAIVGSVAYVVIVGFITVVVAIHENVDDMRSAIEKQNKLIMEMQSKASSDLEAGEGKRIEPKM
jgi:low affinity Fe/Cu permease